MRSEGFAGALAGPAALAGDDEAGIGAACLDIEWSAPPEVGAIMTTRLGGHRSGPWAGFNLGDHVGDDPRHVAAHRARLAGTIGVPVAWLRQVHGSQVVAVTPGMTPTPPEADGSWTAQPGAACAVLVADCLPVLLADRHGRAVGAAHAGWRGLAAGVVEATARAVAAAAGGSTTDLLAWLGPCIGPDHFEVGADVVAAFGDGPRLRPAPRPDGAMRWRADLAGLARDRLHTLGVGEVTGGGWCTVSDARRFYSFRRDGVTGRMAAAVWLAS